MNRVNKGWLVRATTCHEHCPNRFYKGSGIYGCRILSGDLCSRDKCKILIRGGEEGGWNVVEYFTCSYCGYSWTAVFPDGTSSLQCPICQNYTDTDNEKEATL